MVLTPGPGKKVENVRARSCLVLETVAKQTSSALSSDSVQSFEAEVLHAKSESSPSRRMRVGRDSFNFVWDLRISYNVPLISCHLHSACWSVFEFLVGVLLFCFEIVWRGEGANDGCLDLRVDDLAEAVFLRAGSSSGSGGR